MGLLAQGEAFRSTKFTLWQPSLPLEHHLPDYGLTIALYRAARLAWVLLLIPFHFILAISTLLLPRPLHPPPSLLPGETQWTFFQRLLLPLVKRVIWAITDVGGAPRLTPQQERRWIGWLVALLDFAYQDGGANVSLAVEDCVPGDAAWQRRWIKDEASDPYELVHPGPVPMFWFDARAGSEDVSVGARGSRRARDGERVVLYFVGGGYCYGSPTDGNRCFILAKRTGLVVVGANYRKATSADRAFPAALQDAITAYTHLLELGYTDIILAGDSAGAGLALSLVLYLTNTLHHVVPDLVLPSAMLLYSPWVDLTLSSYRSKLALEYEDDILNPSMLLHASNSYLRNLKAQASPSIDINSSSPFALGASHPFLSPALPSSLPTLRSLAKAYSPETPLRMLIFAGGSEMFAPEIRGLVAGLRQASREGGGGGVAVEYVEVKGEVHCFPLVPSWVSPAAGRALKRVASFLTA
ncbi:Alpha/Beta hydrolase protein [Leucosporidium creatinivorum]|uniref:Alpha/Beta hydrolase protein n=1 Tax=Leucosporidium creatinivorum TaxID=106004 RepID=A0A1Y2D7T4_9BASI|nr:Alpha/Beta hydrolase protein [Leucosporidium creatinivorum]